MLASRCTRSATVPFSVPVTPLNCSFVLISSRYPVICPSVSVDFSQLSFGLAVTAAVFVGVTRTGIVGLALADRPPAVNFTSTQKSISASLMSSNQADIFASLSGTVQGGIEIASTAAAVLSEIVTVPSPSLFHTPELRYDATVKRAVFAPTRFSSERATFSSIALWTSLIATSRPAPGPYQKMPSYL